MFAGAIEERYANKNQHSQGDKILMCVQYMACDLIIQLYMHRGDSQTKKRCMQPHHPQTESITEAHEDW